MKKIHFDSLSIIGYGLMALYGVSLWYYIGTFRVSEFWSHATFLSLMFIVLFANSFFVIAHVEWSRKILTSLNIVMAVYILALHWYYPGYVHLGYVFINVALVLFFDLKRIKVIFKKNWETVRKSILVVDDDEGLQKTIKRILLTSGYSVLSAMTGERGIQVAKLQKPDLIILDVLLPGMKGREVCKILKSSDATKSIPVIFLTAKDSPDDVAAEKAAGGLMHITKPVNAKTLMAEIRKVIS
jgi:CheY-like chemotaxis protein